MREGYKAGFERGQQAKLRLRVWWAILTARFADWRDSRKAVPIEDEPAHKYKSPITKQVFKDVKHSLKLVGMARGYETVAKVAAMHNVGRSTAYEIKAAPTYGHYKGQHTTVAVKGSSRTIKVPVQVR